MKKELKSQIIESISAHLQKYPNFYLANIEGLNAGQTVTLRRACFDQGIKLSVVKNTLFAHVIKGFDNEEIKNILPVLEGIADWTEQNIHDTVIAAIAEAGLKNGAVLWPLRIAISGLASTPGGAFEIAWLLGKKETLRRLEEGLRKLS